MASLIRPFIYVGIIFLAFGMKKAGIFGPRDYRVASLMFTNVTLPANIIHVFVGFSPSNQLYWLVLIGFAFGLVPTFIMYGLRCRRNTLSRAYCMINASGTNVGGYVLPIVQLFFGSTGAVYTSMFDLGNALVMSGVGYSTTSAMLGLGRDENHSRKLAFMNFFKRMFSSVSLDVYLLMLILLVIGVNLPEVVGTVTEPFANANGFVSMFMLGLMFKVEVKDREKLRDVICVLVFRVAFGVCLSMVCYHFLPFEEEIRKVVALCMVGPVGSMASVFTEKAGLDPSLSSFANSLSCIISFVVMMLYVYVVF